MALDRACTAHGPPTESAHCSNLATRRKEEQKATVKRHGGELWGKKDRRLVLLPGQKQSALQETE